MVDNNNAWSTEYPPVDIHTVKTVEKSDVFLLLNLHRI